MKYVIAVSGGVDSVVLLDAFAHNRLIELTAHTELSVPKDDIIVAHFDHGIREDSREDEQFVRQLAEHYGVEYEAGEGKLGSNASEATAREVRYNFLRQCSKKNNAPLITAHHQDDAVETMLINLIRGTGWRGLAPMATNINETSSYPVGAQQVVRPLLDTTKQQILSYAKNHQLKWREDSTNTNQAYLRNYIRHTLLPTMLEKNPQTKFELLKIAKQTEQLKSDIATELQKIENTVCVQTGSIATMHRYFLIMAPRSVALELLYESVRKLEPSWHPEQKALHRVLHFIKTGQPGKQYELTARVIVVLSRSNVQFKKR